MGAAKRRRDYERAHAEKIAAGLALRGERWALIDEMAATDPECEPERAERLDARLREVDALLISRTVVR